MSYKIDGTSIYLTRGDTFEALVIATRPDPDYPDDPSKEVPYIPAEGDSIRFAMKSDYGDPEPLLLKDIPTDTMVLILNPEDTKHLPFGKYVYDIQLTYAGGKTDTFITKARLRLTEEVD